jgi:hypothetical protein
MGKRACISGQSREGQGRAGQGRAGQGRTHGFNRRYPLFGPQVRDFLGGQARRDIRGHYAVQTNPVGGVQEGPQTPRQGEHRVLGRTWNKKRKKLG